MVQSEGKRACKKTLTKCIMEQKAYLNSYNRTGLQHYKNQYLYWMNEYNKLLLK